MIVFLLACTPEATTPPIEAAETEWIQDIAVSAGELVPTALSVTFSTPEAATSWVEFGLQSIDEFHTPTGSVDTAHSAAVIGVPPLSEVTMRVVVEIDGEQHTSGTFTHETGQLLPETPILEVVTNNYDGPATSLVMSIFGNPSTMVMMDLDGTITWSLPQGVDLISYGLAVEHVGDGLMYNEFELGRTGVGTIERIDFLGNPISTVETTEAHHFFTHGPDGELVWLVEEIRNIDGVDVVGDAVMRRSVDGEESVLFSHFEDFTLPQLGNAKSINWTHANWVDWDSARSTCLLSNARTNTIAELTAEGELVRIMGGPGAIDSEYVFGSVEQAFEYPHGPHWSDSGDLLVFSTVDGLSRAVQYELNEDQGQLKEVWSFGESYNYGSQVLGEVQELPDGNLLISWGSVGILQIVSPDREVLWEAQAPLLAFFNQTHVLSDPYTVWQ